MTAASPLLCPVCESERVPVEVSEGRVCCANRECPAYAVPVDADLAAIDFKGLLTAYEKMVADGEGGGSVKLAHVTIRASEIPEMKALYVAVHRVLSERLFHGEPSIQAWNDLIDAHDALCTDDPAEFSPPDHGERFADNGVRVAARLVDDDDWIIPEGDERCDVLKDVCQCLKRKGHAGWHACAHGEWRAEF